VTAISPQFFEPVRQRIEAKRFRPCSWEDLAFEMRESVFDPDGDLVYDSGYYEPNALTNDGQAHMLNVWAREQSNNNKWMMLLNMASPTPAKTSTLSTITEAITINTSGYMRTQVSPTDWSAPALDSGDEQIAASQKTFGPFLGNVPVTHVALASVASTFTGTLFLYVATAYFTANATARTFVAGESYLVTLRDKQT
jgi:hypothetical protein